MIFKIKSYLYPYQTGHGWLDGAVSDSITTLSIISIISISIIVLSTMWHFYRIKHDKKVYSISEHSDECVH